MMGSRPRKALARFGRLAATRNRTVPFGVRRSTVAILQLVVLSSPFFVLGPRRVTAQTAAADLRVKFEARVQEIAAKVDGVVGYAIVDLTSGERITHLEHATFPTASAIKLAIVYELFKQAEEGTLRLDDSIRLDRTQAVGGTGVLVEMGTPTLSIRDYAVLMVSLSDNTATNILIDRVGIERIAARMQRLGLNGTRLRRHMMDTAAARRGEENVSTPDELARLLIAMNDGMPEAITLLKKPKDNRLRKGLPEGVASADKSGELEGVRVDAGIVYAKNRPYVLSVMTTFLKDEAEGERAIETISRTAYEYFSRLGSGGALGRLNGR
jgi:beta-lactamase class A